MEEEPSTISSNDDPSLEINPSVDSAEGNDFCLLNEDDIEMDDNEDGMSLQSRNSSEDTQEISVDTSQLVSTIDVETMKRKAEEIASSLKKFLTNRTSETNVPSEDYEPPEELKRHRERSVFVAQKLKEDRLLFEESKKRNEAVVDKVRTVKQIHKSITESAKEMKSDSSFDETMVLRLKIDRLEASLSHLQTTLTSKNQIIFENKENIRLLNETVESTRAAYLSYVEQSHDEIQQLRDEHVKALERIANSRDEFCNQLETVRKKCLLMENDLKLSEFARFRLVSRNAELRERVRQLETELKIPPSKSMSIEDLEDAKPGIPVRNQTLAVSALYPKVESLAIVTNEFYSYLGNSDDDGYDEPIQLDEDCDPLQSMDEISDRLESMFYVVRDKLSTFSELEDHAKQNEEKIRQLEEVIEENKNQDAKLKKIIATMKAKIQSETNINKDLTEQLSKAQEHIKLIEQSSGQDWLIRCQELQKANQELQYELDTLQKNFSAQESSSQLQETINHLKRELEAKVYECEQLRRFCEQLEDSNDKLENDFVVLQKRDCDEEENWKRAYNQLKDENAELLENCSQLRNENVALHENINSSVEKVNEYENERFTLYRQIDELRRIEHDLTERLENINMQSFAFQDAKVEHDNEMQTEIENLTGECAALTKELEEVKRRLSYESSSSRDLREQMQFAENTNASLSHEIHDLQKRNQDLETLKITLENNIDELNERLKYLENEKIHLQQCIDRSKEALTESDLVNEEREAELERLKHTIASLQAEIEELRAEKQVIVAEREQLKTKIINDEVNVETLKRANDELTSSVRQLRQSVSEIEDEKEQLASQYEHQYTKDKASLQELENLKSQIETLKNEKEYFEDLKSQVEILANEKQQLFDRFEQYRDRIQNLEKENESLRNQDSREFLERIATLETEKRQLEEECDKFKSKYQRLQIYCKANIHKASSNDGSSSDVDIWKSACMKAQDELKKVREREAQLNEALEQAELKKSAEQQYVIDSLNAEVESWKRKYEEMKEALLAAQQKVDSLKELVAEYEEECQRNRDLLAQKELQMTSINENQFSSMEPPLDSLSNEPKHEVRETTSDENQVLDIDSAVDVVVNECIRRTDEDIQKAVDEVVSECILQTDDLRKHINELKEENCKLREQHKEMEHCQMKVSQLQHELQTLQLNYNDLEQRLYNMDEESGAEIAKYQELLTETRSELNSMEKCLAKTRSFLQQKDNDFQEYRFQTEEFINSERAKYEQRLAELSINKLGNNTVDANVQTDTDKDHVASESEKQPASISKYFDYYKGKIANVLQPEDQLVDYSNWILPEKQDIEYQTRYQQVPTFGYEDRQEDTSLDKSSQTHMNTQSQASQVEIPSAPRAENVIQFENQPFEKLPISQIINQLRELIIYKTKGDAWEMNEADWLSEELDVYDENFVDTALKFIDLFEAVIHYYSTVPQAEILLGKFKNVLDPHQTKQEDSSTLWNHRDSYHQLVTLCTHLECENKYLVEAITFVEDAVLAKQTAEIIRFQDVLLSWRTDVNFEESDIIDRVCEEYDIIPNKFAAVTLLTSWKETMLKLFEPLTCVVTTTPDSDPITLSIESSLVTVMKKNHKLIGDLYYKYGADKNFNPNEFFDQINDINEDVEHLVKFVKGETSETLPGKVDVHHHDHEEGHHHHHDHDHSHEHHHHDHDHSPDHHHHDHDHDHDHDHGAHHHSAHDEPKSKLDESNTEAELKLLLAESNKKIDSLVRELMEAKSSKEYSEIQQFHTRLDETLYQLHLRDIHNVELTREITQLLTERDTLQLRLSSIIRENEELRHAFASAKQSSDDGVHLSRVKEKLEELSSVNYMKDPRISETSKQYHTTGMQLFSDDSAENAQKVQDESASGFSVPSLFKWITGDNDGK